MLPRVSGDIGRWSCATGWHASTRVPRRRAWHHIFSLHHFTATFARTVTTQINLSQGDFNVAIGSITMAVLLGLVGDL